MRRAGAAGALAAVAAAALFVGLQTGATDGDGGDDAEATVASGNTATVARRDLAERETIDGTLGYSGSRTVANGLEASPARRWRRR